MSYTNLNEKILDLWSGMTSAKIPELLDHLNTIGNTIYFPYHTINYVYRVIIHSAMKMRPRWLSVEPEFYFIKITTQKTKSTKF